MPLLMRPFSQLLPATDPVSSATPSPPESAHLPGLQESSSHVALTENCSLFDDMAHTGQTAYIIS
jgi:hypothetical protein